ncbi:MAG: hypothetical protein Kow0069_08290 [Promethearchaeota archaeon]
METPPSAKFSETSITSGALVLFGAPGPGYLSSLVVSNFHHALKAEGFVPSFVPCPSAPARVKVKGGGELILPGIRLSVARGASRSFGGKPRDLVLARSNFRGSDASERGLAGREIAGFLEKMAPAHVFVVDGEYERGVGKVRGVTRVCNELAAKQLGVRATEPSLEGIVGVEELPGAVFRACTERGLPATAFVSSVSGGNLEEELARLASLRLVRALSLRVVKSFNFDHLEARARTLRERVEAWTRQAAELAREATEANHGAKPDYYS